MGGTGGRPKRGSCYLGSALTADEHAWWWGVRAADPGHTRRVGSQLPTLSQPVFSLVKTSPLARILKLPKMHEDLNLELPAKDISLLKDVQRSLLAPLITIVMITVALLPFKFLVAPSPGLPLSWPLWPLFWFDKNMQKASRKSLRRKHGSVTGFPAAKKQCRCSVHLGGQHSPKFHGPKLPHPPTQGKTWPGR